MQIRKTGTGTPTTSPYDLNIVVLVMVHPFQRDMKDESVEYVYFYS